VYLTGGALRDLFRADGRRPTDFDFLVAGPRSAAFIEALGAFGVLSHGPFGSPRWFPQAAPSCHADLMYLNRFTNGLWRCHSVPDALNQFDFTANALAFDLRHRRLIDPQQGVRDIEAGVIRAVRFDVPDEPICSGHDLSRRSVLWFRLMHYACELGFTIESATRQWLRDNRRLVRQAAAFSETFFPPRLGLI
jgi:hypothetical protein